MVASATGYGFGTRTLPGLSNVLRCIAFSSGSGAASDEHMTLINFEIDDQSSEDLAIALDRLRATPGVVDVVQGSVVGKKGRMCTTVQMQVNPAFVNSVADAVFVETSTIGLRMTDVTRRVLPRSATPADSESGARVKVVQRPQGLATAKAEIDDVSQLQGRAARERARIEAEQRALRNLQS
jgi:uncharacterized protein (DUF111 family)